MKIGLTYEEAMDQPVSRILTLMAIEQIKHEGARLARDPNEVFDNETQDILEVFPDLK